MKARVLYLLCLFVFLLPAIAGAENQSVALPRDLAVIGDSAFADCISLEGEIVLSPEVAVGEGAFAGCPATILQNKENEKYRYTVKDTSEVILTKYIGDENAMNLAIPATLDGLPVVEIGDSAFENLKKNFTLLIPQTVTRIGSRAFADTAIANLVFPFQGSLPYDAVKADSFDWDSMVSVRIWKGDAQNPEREPDLYDFFVQIQAEQEKNEKKLEINRLDPYILCSADTAVAFEGTKVTLTANAENLPFSGVSWQWQESRDGSSWTDSSGGEEYSTAQDREFTFTAHEGMATNYRCMASYVSGNQGDVTLMSEDTAEIRFMEQELDWQLTAEANGTSVKLSWNPDLKGFIPFTVYMAPEDPDVGGYTALSMVEEDILDTEYTLELLKPNTNYMFAVMAVTPGKVIPEVQYATTGDAPGADETVYRALLIGEVDFPGDFCSRNLVDAKKMRNMLRQVKGASKLDATDGGMYGVIAKKDLNRQGILDAIQEAFGDADDNDVSLFFIATHGDVDDTGEEAGRLATITKSMENDDLLLKDLAEALLSVKGEIIVFLESCGSGAAVISDEDAAAMDEEREKEAKAFAEAAVHAFAEAEGEAGDLASRTGELRQEKFHVLTAAAYHQYAWGWEGDEKARNYFPEDLMNGVLKDAPLNEKGQVTLEALYRYIQEVGDSETYIDYDNQGNRIEYHQNVQVWPENCADPLFLRME